MTQDDILRMAVQAGFTWEPIGNLAGPLERFAELVAAATQPTTEESSVVQAEHQSDHIPDAEKMVQQAEQPTVKESLTAHVEQRARPVAWKDLTYGNLHHQDFGNSIPLYTHPQPALRPETCKACGEGKADLVVLRICDKCGSEYSGQAEFDLPIRLQTDRQAEPVAYCTGYYGGRPTVAPVSLTTVLPVGLTLYTHPQPAQQPLTDEQIQMIDRNTHFHESPDWPVRFARAIERAHRIGGEA